ncbi:MAG: glutamate formimidoyltransferase [Armatimonadetes bacterium]|nr:glutamate formimidoyltransferase [Armatimonadota bacterium]
MSRPLVECVPNFSEGRDESVIRAIAEAVRSVDGVRLLDVDPGQATNRTVYTFVGPPEPVVEAAVRAAKAGCALIDMSKHHGEHPRFGALDVCPLVPIADITMDETVEWSKTLARRLGEEAGLSVYLYERSSVQDHRRNLADVRAGEYEGLEEKLRQPGWTPDFGPSAFQPKTGATAVGARPILVAYNVNLNTTSTRRANAVAFDIRERGRVKRHGDPLVGDVVRDENGEPIYEPGALKNVKAIGWFIEEYGVAQVSINLTDIVETPLHKVFDEACDRAQARGMRVTGSELVGLVPLSCLLEAGRFFLKKQQRSTGVSDSELIKIAVKSMGLDELGPFDPQRKVIEYAMRDAGPKRLVDMSVRRFVEETASESAAPGGGSISATMGAMGAALATMVANLSSHKRGWDDRWEEFSDAADAGKACHDTLLRLVDDDTDAFNALMEAFGLPKRTDDEKALRSAAVQSATKGAVEIPLAVMRTSLEAMAVVKAMAETGNPNSVSDAGVGALAATAAVRGAALNVKINCASIKDKGFVETALAEAAEIEAKAVALERDILATVERTMSG